MLRVGESPVDALAFSAEGKLLATGSRDGRVKLWSLPEFKQVELPSTPRAQEIVQLQFVEGQDWLLISNRGELLKWDYESNKAHNLGRCSGPFSLSPNRQFVLAIVDEIFQMVDLNTHRETHSYSPFAGVMRSVSWSPNGPDLSIVMPDHMLKIWNTRNWHVRRPLSPAIPPPTQLSYSKKGHALFVTSARTNLHAYTIREHGYASFVRRYCIDSVWLQVLGTHLDRYMRSHYDAGSEYVKLLTHDLTARGEWNNTLCQLDTSPQAHRVGADSRPITRKYGVSTAATLPGNRLLVGSVDGSITISDAHSGKRLSLEHFPMRSRLMHFLARLPEVFGFEGANPSMNFKQSALRVAVEPLGERYVAIVGGGKLIAGELTTGKRILQKLPQNETYQDVTYCDSPVGPGWIATTNHSVQLLDAVSLEPLGTEMTIDSPIRSVAVSADDTLVAIGRADRVIAIRSVVDGKLIRSLRGHAASVDALAFSPTDQTTLVSGSADATVRVWGINTGVSLLTLNAHTGPVTCVAFRPDGQQLATGASLPDGVGEVLFWDAPARINDDVLPKKQRPRSMQ